MNRMPSNTAFLRDDPGVTGAAWRLLRRAPAVAPTDPGLTPATD